MHRKDYKMPYFHTYIGKKKKKGFTIKLSSLPYIQDFTLQTNQERRNKTARRRPYVITHKNNAYERQQKASLITSDFLYTRFSPPDNQERSNKPALSPHMRPLPWAIGRHRRVPTHTAQNTRKRVIYQAPSGTHKKRPPPHTLGLSEASSASSGPSLRVRRQEPDRQ